MLNKDGKRKRPIGELDENDFYEESDLSLGDLSSSDLELAHSKKKGRTKAKKTSSSDPYSKNMLAKGYTSDIDESGENKVDEYGRLFDGREYKVPVFSLPTRGNTLFMFSKDPAAVLGYRDSFVFVKRNTSLVKVQMNNEERGYLVDSNQLRPSFRTRELNAVTARSVFKRFGHRIVKNGVRGRDDYYYSGEFAEQPLKKANHSIKPLPTIAPIKSIPSHPSTQPPSSLTVGTNRLKFDVSTSKNALDWIHCAAVNARQFNSKLFSYRQSNSAHYDLLTNVYQISKSKQLNIASQRDSIQ
ncbi:chromatin remodelling complex Rsc7/Swp82 subunit-domain-containing protein [Sporodiniella umbellata]|nr:chromatin remodelling complex Rsc7/Swp82 subunit-domain-containing protein [Sporodiniella umbellata]